MDNVTDFFTSVNNETVSEEERDKRAVSTWVFFVALLLFFIIFPFYEYVYLKNREKEKDTIVYPVINHFYNILRLMYKGFCLFMLMIVLLVIIIPYLKDNKVLNLGIFICFAFASLQFLLGNFIRTNNFLLCLLSFQRFMVLFFPSTEKYVIYNENELKRIIWWTYANFLIPLTMKGFLVPNVDVVSGFIATICFVASDIMIITSASLYIPIYRMIKKQKHLYSAQFNKPHRYVMWQLIVILLCRLVIELPFILLSDNIERAMNSSDYIEIVTTCLTIQLAYLGCCKRNLESLKSFLLEKWDSVSTL
ncbi:hypothetical protein CRE_19852 [Caenorhabditis remanei]|uniref:Serpentine Receptor, class Z n=1 Tax=Caenorhabditis remanei TaxID=31234 RepID=E3MTN7_CAERE|nr:hypothetical protein CRE_19852 [Caenorhabditis remanei]